MAGLIPLSEAARRLGVERQSVYRFVKQGRLSSVLDASGHLLVFEDEVAAFEVKPPGTPPKEGPNLRVWTRAMTMKRVHEWNRFVAELPEDGSTAEHIAAFEKQHGWTRDELQGALNRLEEARR